MENMYDLDIAIEIIARMQAIKSNELHNAVNELDKKRLEREYDVLRSEKNALYFEKNSQAVIDKAFNVYAPILRAELEYAAV